MTRPPNWDVALAQWARATVGLPFEWGKTDCVSLVRASLTSVHGRPVLPDRPSWSTLSGARRASAKASIEAELHRAGGLDVAFEAAQAGDTLLLGREAGGFDGVGVVLDEQVLLANPERGVHAVPRAELHGLGLKVVRI